MRRRFFVSVLVIGLLWTGGASAFTFEAVSKRYEKSAVRVYIYHTHTYEAYKMPPDAPYRETEAYRTADPSYNIVRVGAELTRLLEAGGVDVWHDDTAYEPPRLSSAYARSLTAIEKTIAGGDVYDLYIDLHRDSYSSGNGANTVLSGGREAARLLFLIGQGTGQSDGDARPKWEANQKIAQALSDAMNEQAPSISRGVSLKSGSYNQQAAVGCLLIEVGNNKNTLEEALAAMPCLAQAICAYFDARD